LGEEEALVVLRVEAAAVEVVEVAVKVVEVVVLRLSIWENEALLPVNLPRGSLGRFEVSLGIDMATRGNQKQKRSVKDSRERLKYPSLAVGSTMKAQSYLRVPKSSRGISELGLDAKIQAQAE